MLLRPPFENWYLRRIGLRQVEGPLRLPAEVFGTFLAAPYDPSPDFVLPPKWRRREHDHPRYQRFCYALARATGARRILEVGSSAGGTTAGWARALAEARDSGGGGGGGVQLTCVDNDSYNEGVYPQITGQNIERVGLPLSCVTFHCGDSGTILKQLQETSANFFDIYLVDANHTYDAALADIENGWPMVRPGGLIAVHDVDRSRAMSEATPQHPAPVYDAFMDFARGRGFLYCIVGFVRKHLGLVKIPD